jgi:DnaJ like chaperone protein
MSWWGKLIGGAFGYMLGGPLGALLGAALGNKFDQGFKGVMLDESLGSGDTERVQTAFFTATFSIMGHLAKADGRVSEDEIALARHIMAQMSLDAAQRKIAIKLFAEGKQDDFPLDEVLEQFRRECHRRRNLIQMFVEVLIATAMADGKLDSAEKKLLLHIGGQLGFSRQQFEQLIAMVQAQQQYAGGEAVKRGPSLKDAYAVLGVEKGVSDAEVKKAYRRLMNQHHPDKLVSKGLPEEMMVLAKEKSQEIRAAYDQIKAARGI